MKESYFVDPTSIVHESAIIGRGTKIWHFSHIMKDARIGEDCVFGQNCHVANDVIIGSNVKVQNNVSIYTGTIIEDDVFLGPSSVLTNVTNPRSQVNRHALYETTLIRRGATVGANATIVCGIELGRYCFIGAGAVVTKDVPDYALMVGSPARRVGWMSRHGHRLIEPDADGVMCCPESEFRYKEVRPGQLRCLDLDEDSSLPKELSNGSKSYDEYKARTAFQEAALKVPLLDLKAQYTPIKDEVLTAVAEVLESQVCIGGPKVAELERKIAASSDCKYAVGVSSGTDALLCSLMALGIGRGDEVITTPFTFFATAGSIARVGAAPVFVDIDPGTYNINPALIESAVTKRTKAIMPVHLFGQMCDMDPIMEVANRHGLHVIEDAAQSITSTYKGRKAGSIGTVGCFSFFPSKNLGGAGDGGMIVTNDEKLWDRLVLMRNHGAQPKYFHKFVGGNFRLDPIQAAVLVVKLPHLESWSAARRRNARRYDAQMANYPVVTPFIREDCVSIYNQYVVRLEDRDGMRQALREAGISSEIYYPCPLHKQECFAAVIPDDLQLPESEEAAKHVLALPVYPELTTEMLDHVASTLLYAHSTPVAT